MTAHFLSEEVDLSVPPKASKSLPSSSLKKDPKLYNAFHLPAQTSAERKPRSRDQKEAMVLPKQNTSPGYAVTHIQGQVSYC